jgi:hypothetical protein
MYGCLEQYPTLNQDMMNINIIFRLIRSVQEKYE